VKQLFFTLLLVYSLNAQIFVSEIERNPVGSESASPGGKSHEYIELVNLSSDTFTIDSLSLFDGVVSDELVIIEDSLLLPGAVLLILDKDYFPISELYPIHFDSTASIATINHTTICGGLTTSDGFIVQYGSDTLVSVVDAFLPEGEKLQFTSFDGSDEETTTLSPNSFFSEQIWIESVPSPGTIPQLNGDLYHQWAVSSSELIIFTQSFGSSWSYAVSIGANQISSGNVGLELQIDTISLPDTLQQLTIEFHSDNLSFIDTVDLSQIRIPENSILINEINPRGSPEWIELYNQSDEPISVTNWFIFNSEDTMNISIQQSIAPEQFLLISRDEISALVESEVQSQWFSLDNYRDTLFLGSPFGVVDSVMWNYTNFKEWDDETLHRVPNSDGFIASAIVPAEPTPGEKSIVYGDETPVTLTVAEQLFSPNGDGRDEELHIKVTHPSHFTATARIFSREGNETIRFEISGGEAFWNGSNQSGTTARRGPYVLLVEFIDNLTGATSVLRSGVVLWR